MAAVDLPSWVSPTWGQNQRLLPTPCLMGSPHVGKMPTQPLPSLGPRSGELIKTGYMARASLKALATR